MNIACIPLVLSYAAALIGSLWLGYQLRFDFTVPEETGRTFLLVFAWVISLKLICLWRFRQFDVLLGYFSLPDFSRLFWVLLATSLFIFGVSAQLGSDYAPPKSVVLIDFSFSLPDSDAPTWSRLRSQFPVPAAQTRSDSSLSTSRFHTR